MKIAIVSFFHTESSLCLAKYLAKQGCYVDFYYVANLLHDRKGTSGFEYSNAKRGLGNHLLSREEIPELFDYFENLPVRIFLSRIIHHDRYPLLNKVLMYLNMFLIRCRHYDAINIVGQTSWIEVAHNVLKKENLIHTFHEIGNHDGELNALPIVKEAIDDKSKVILHSKYIYERFLSIPNAKSVTSKVIPFGKFETLKLYVRDQNIPLPFKDSKPILLFYGYILPYKGLDILAESIKLLKKDWGKFNIVVAGNGDDESLPFFASLPNGYVVNRFLSNDEMMNLIRQSSVILLPYKSASQTGVIPTCALYDKPVIATKVGAFSEMVRDGFNGLLVEPNNPQAFAGAILKSVKQLVSASSLSNESFHYGYEYDWNSIAQETLSFLRM